MHTFITKVLNFYLFLIIKKCTIQGFNTTNTIITINLFFFKCCIHIIQKKWLPIIKISNVTLTCIALFFCQIEQIDLYT